MNLRNVLRAYSLLRQLSDDESALLNILRALNDNDREQLIATMSDKPQKKAGKKPSIRVAADARCIGYPPGSVQVCGLLKKDLIHHSRTAAAFHEFIPPPGKSKHATSLASAIKGATGDVTVPLTGVEAKSSVGQLGVKIEEDGILSSGGNRCEFIRADNKPCHLLPDHNIHHMKTANEYHEFQPAEQAAATSGGD